MVTSQCVTESEIEAAYQASGNRLGWRFLYSPSSVLKSAEVAFLGLNPGGDHEPSDHARFAPESGSAYVTESWVGFPTGQSPLQRQVRGLFHALGVEPSTVLSGNLIPFRSQSFDRLIDPQGALRFGRSLWERVLSAARPSLLITMGADVTKHLASVVRAKPEAECRVGWGSLSGQRWSFPGGVMVSLPHLSRFRIVDRPASEDGLSALFSNRWRP